MNAVLTHHQDTLPHSAPPTRKLLLIEDNRSDALVVRRMLRDLPMGEMLLFHEVPRLNDALALLFAEAFDLVILDLNLLDASGLPAVAAVRATAPGTPIVVYRGSDDPDLRKGAVLCGAQHYLVKSADGPMRFRLFVESVLARAAQ